MSILSHLRKAVRRVGLDVRRFPETFSLADLRLARLLDRHRFTLVLDVGANVGEFGASLRRYGYGGKIVSFEPLADAFAALNERVKADKTWRAINVALGDAEGDVEIFVSDNSVSSSLLPMLEAHERAAPRAHVSSVQTVAMTSLDRWTTGEQIEGERVFIKIDTQGFEGAVLDGATLLLGHVDAVQLEVSFVPLYDGSPLYLEMFTRMDALGFVPVSMAPVFFDPSSDQLLQADVVFLRNTLAHGAQP